MEAAAKTCSMDLLAGGTSYKAIREADEAAGDGDPTTWNYVTSAAAACVEDADGETEITGAGPTKTFSITLTNGVPAKPVEGAVGG